MAEHRRLDEFGSATPEGDEPTPPSPTYRWDPSGTACGSCGEEVTELWESEYGPICAACKEW